MSTSGGIIAGNSYFLLNWLDGSSFLGELLGGGKFNFWGSGLGLLRRCLLGICLFL